MKANNDSGNEHFADKLRQFTSEPPEAVWENISAEMGRGGRRRNLYVILAVAASLALAVTVGLTVFGPGTSGTDQVAATEDAPGADMFPGGSQEQQEMAGLQQVNTDEQHEADELQQDDVAMQQKTDVKAAGNEAQLREEGKSTRLERKVKEAIHEAAREEQPILAVADETIVETGDPGGEEDLLPSDEAGAQSDRERSDDIEEESGLTEEEAIAAIQETFAPADSVQDTQDSRKGQRWQIGAAISPQYTYRDASAPDATQNRVVNSSETGMLAYAGGLRFSFLPTDRITVETGVYYNKMGLNIGAYESYWARLNSDWDFVPVENRNVVTLANSIGTIAPEGDEVYYNKYTMQTERTEFRAIEPVIMTFNGDAISTITQTFSYLEIPLNLRYKVIDRRVDLQLIGGLSTNVLMSNAVIGNTSSESVKIGSVTDVRTMNYSGNAGIGVVYDIFDRLKVSIEPRFRYYLNSVNNPLMPSTRPYSFGLFTGVNYSF